MKKNTSVFLEKFRRVTSAKSYMPEIDGLRFIAVFWVVVIMHTPNFVNVKFYDSRLISGYGRGVIIEGLHGVSFFFMISGFILGLPFARQQLGGGQKVSLTNYYLRRFTRLEPPYLAALLIAFAGLVLINGYSFTALLPHLGASAIYCHQFIYGTKSSVLGVAWSLEVEVQFYVLAPLLALLYRIKRAVLRRSIFIVLIVFYTVFAYKYLWIGSANILKSPHDFLIGMFLCDLYVNKVSLPGKAKAWFISGIGLLFFLPLFLSLYDLPSFLLKNLMMGLLFYIGLTIPGMKKLLSTRWVSIIGGMCYSIYLLQFIIMSAAARVLGETKIANPWIGFWLYSALLVVLVLAGSMIFYRFIEQPCMRKGWYRTIFRRFSAKA